MKEIAIFTALLLAAGCISSRMADYPLPQKEVDGYNRRAEAVVSDIDAWRRVGSLGIEKQAGRPISDIPKLVSRDRQRKTEQSCNAPTLHEAPTLVEVDVPVDGLEHATFITVVFEHPSGRIIRMYPSWHEH